MIIITIFFLALPILLLLLLTTSKNSRLPPGPQALPLIGNLHLFEPSKAHACTWNLSKQYGPLMFLRLGFIPAIVVSSAKLAEVVLKTQDLVFCSRPCFKGQQLFSYNGKDMAFSPYGVYYSEIRKTCVVHLFSSARVQTYRPIREHEVSLMIGKISELAFVSKHFDLYGIMLSMTTNMMCRIVLGSKYKEENQGTRIRSLINGTQNLFIPFLSDFFPYMTWLDKLNGTQSLLKRKCKEFDDFYEDIIKEQHSPDRPEPEHEEFLDVLLQMWKNQTFTVPLTLDHIKAVLMNLFIAGIDPSAITMVWAMTYLMKNPRAMQKAQEEIRSLVGNKGFVDEDDIQKGLPYLKAVMKESMRLQPAAPVLIPRETTRKCNLSGYEIPAKTVVMVNLYAIARDPEVWENPEEFRPERFIENSSIDLKGQDFELIPFGAGRRICPGLYMGAATVELSLANLIYKFDWEMPIGMKREDIDTEASPGISMNKKNPLMLLAKEYRFG